jgi:hypothetical protein
MRKTVFISSTYQDLKEERKKVWECLQKFDVSVKGMEQFGARKTDPLTTCLSEVDQSDIYVGIFGMRYGSEDGNTMKSFSQLEYERAIERNLEIFIYLIDENNSSVTPSLIQFDKIDKLNNFKSILKERHTIDTFASVQDLIAKLSSQFAKNLSPISNDQEEDPYELTKQILDLFFLIPAAYSGREIRLRVKFIGKPKPVSRALCQLFNLSFGKTIICEIEVVYPTFEFKNFVNIIIEHSLHKEFSMLDRSNTFEVLANVLFQEEKVKSLTTNFQDRMIRVYNYDIDATNFDDPSAYEPYNDILKKGDGQIALKLKNILKSD